MSGKLSVFTIFEGGMAEVQWSLNEPSDCIVEGYILVFEDGTATFPFRHPETDEPYVFIMAKDGRTRLVRGEDQYADTMSAMYEEDVVWSLTAGGAASR